MKLTTNSGDRRDISNPHFDIFSEAGYPIEEGKPIPPEALPYIDELCRKAEEAAKSTKAGLEGLGKVDAAVTEIQGAYNKAQLAHGNQIQKRVEGKNWLTKAQTERAKLEQAHHRQQKKLSGVLGRFRGS